MYISRKQLKKNFNYLKEIDKKKLESLAYETKNSVCGGAYYDEKKGHIVRYHFSDYGPTKFYRKKSNKKLRKTSEIGDYSSYKKQYDLKWEIL